MSRTLPILLLPGTLCDARLFVPVLAELGLPDAIVPDMAGAETASAMARQILAAAPEQFALLGFSLGGIVALEVIAQAPERVSGLALIDSTPRPDRPGNAAIRRAAVARARAEGTDTYILDGWAAQVAPVNRNNDGLRQTVLAMARSCGPDVLASQSELAIGRADSRPRLGAINVPALILAGEHDGVCPPDAQAELASGIAGAQFFTIPDAGHFAPLENPAVVARHVRQWLDRIDPLPPMQFYRQEP